MVDTTPDELYCFLAITLLMLFCQKNAIKQYWSMDPLLENLLAQINENQIDPKYVTNYNSNMSAVDKSNIIDIL